jgi:hypothetical protein
MEDVRILQCLLSLVTSRRGVQNLHLAQVCPAYDSVTLKPLGVQSVHTAVLGKGPGHERHRRRHTASNCCVGV